MTAATTATAMPAPVCGDRLTHPRAFDTQSRIVDHAKRTHTDHVLAEQWRHYRGDIVLYANYLLAGDIHAAEDVAQETAIRLWKHPEVLNDRRPLGSWLRTVAHNIVVDRVRRRRARPVEVTLLPGIDSESQEEFSLVDEADAVATILSRLSPRHRIVVLEVYVRDRPVVEVAAELRIPTGTVKSRCHTALRQLRATYRPAPRPLAHTRPSDRAFGRV